VRFSYPIGEDSVFQLTVEPGTLEMEDKGMKPGLIVEGRFRRRVTGESSEANLESAVNLIRNCKSDLRAWAKFVRASFYPRS
jgi:hypothetical protein